MVGDKVWLKSYNKKKGVNPKLAPKYQGPYEITEVLAYHTYRVRKDGKGSIQHEGRIKLHTESDHNASPAAEQQPDHQTVEQTMGPGDSIGDLLIKSSKWQEDEKTHRAAEMKKGVKVADW